MRIDKRLTECGSGPTCPAAYPTDTAKWVMQGGKISAHLRATLGVPDHEDAVEVTAAVIEQIRRQHHMDLEELGSWIIDNHERDVFRLETLDRYFVDSDEADFRAYLAGAPAPDRAAKRGWLDWLAAAAAEGRTWRRVHIVRLPLTDYVRFEAEWCYLDNSAAGEQIRIIDLSETDIDLDYLHLDDYYIVDGRAAVLGYDGEGRFLHARVVDNPSRLIEARDTLWNAAEPFAQWWQRHPEHRRVRRGAA